MSTISDNSSQMKIKKTLALIIATASMLFLSACNSGTQVSNADPLKITESDWVRGNPNAKVVIVEYSDFQCPACRAHYPLVKEITQSFGDEIALVYRHFPLEQHPQAVPAARAAEAAGAQGKFWEMHDLIFEGQDEWASTASYKDIFKGYAEQIGLDMEQFEKDYESRDTLRRIQSTRSDDSILPIRGTPTFFVNEQPVRLGSLENAKAMIQAEIDKSKAPAQPL